MALKYSSSALLSVLLFGGSRHNFVVSDDLPCATDYYTGCPDDCDSLTRNHGGRQYCDCAENEHCSDTCGSGRYGNDRNGCQQCEDGYFKRDYGSACVSCSDVFMDTCDECSDFHGCVECSDGYDLVMDDSCGLSQIDFGYCSPQTCEEDEYDYVENTLDVTPWWLYGRNGVGSRESGVEASELFLSDDMSVHHRKSERYPLPCALVWSSLSIYKDFQSAVPTHTNTTHFSGPVNEVGEIIHFFAVTTVGNFEVYEELSIKHDEHFIWQIKLPFGGNIYFTEYFYTLTLYPDVYINPENNEITSNESCLAMTDIEYRFQNYLSEAARLALMIAAKENLGVYTDFIYEFTLLKVGTTVNGTLIVNTPIDWLFDYIGDLESTEWILRYDEGSLELLQPDIRQFTLNENTSTLIQRIHTRDEINYQIIYENLNYRVFNILAFREEYRFTKISDTETEIFAVFTFVPKYAFLEDTFKGLFQGAVDDAVDALPDLLYDLYSDEMTS